MSGDGLEAVQRTARREENAEAAVAERCFE